MRRFTPSELHAIDAALMVAACVYDEDALLMKLKQHPASAVRQFEQQAAIARKLASAIAQDEVS